MKFREKFVKFKGMVIHNCCKWESALTVIFLNVDVS